VSARSKRKKRDETLDLDLDGLVALLKGSAIDMAQDDKVKLPKPHDLRPWNARERAQLLVWALGLASDVAELKATLDSSGQVTLFSALTKTALIASCTVKSPHGRLKILPAADAKANSSQTQKIAAVIASERARYPDLGPWAVAPLIRNKVNRSLGLSLKPDTIARYLKK
jgi:hypothetical protein